MNNTSLTFEDFENSNWIRTIAGEVIMPELVRHFVGQVGYYEKKGKSIEIPADKIDIVRCLQIYHQKYFEESKLTIDKVKLEKVLQNHGSKRVTVKFLIDRKIIGLDSKSGLYYWQKNKYSRHLRNENCLYDLAFDW